MSLILGIVWIQKTNNIYSLRLQLYQIKSGFYSALNIVILRKVYSDGMDSSLHFLLYNMNLKVPLDDSLLYLVVHYGHKELYQSVVSFRDA